MLLEQSMATIICHTKVTNLVMYHKAHDISLITIAGKGSPAGWPKPIASYSTTLKLANRATFYFL